MTLRVTILGCGSSAGVPRLGTGWGACDPGEPRNRRRRCSILVERIGGQGITRCLIDASPDLREQLLDAEIDRLDALLLSHDHADHTHGIDDLRPIMLNMRHRIPAHMDARTAAVMHMRFGYIFETPPGSDYPPILTEHRMTADEEVSVGGAGGAIRAMPFDLVHGPTMALGFRFGNIAYTPDVSAIPDHCLRHLEDLDVWIIDALRLRPHPSHFCLDEALEWIGRMKPKRAILTNLHTDLDYAALCGMLPPHIRPAYDGLTIDTTSA